MEYPNYQTSRDAAWKLLIDNKVTALPVKISQICRKDGIVLQSYGSAKELLETYKLESNTIDNDGFSIIMANKKFIFYNELCSIERQRFTVSHEYGHYLRGDVSEKPTLRNKEPSDRDTEMESGANVIASRILSPSCVLWGLKVHTAEEISRLCGISMESAEWRLKRLNLLYEREEEHIKKYGRSCFLLSKLERQVYEQFLPFIKSQDLQSL